MVKTRKQKAGDGLARLTSWLLSFGVQGKVKVLRSDREKWIRVWEHKGRREGPRCREAKRALVFRQGGEALSWDGGQSCDN